MCCWSWGPFLERPGNLTGPVITGSFEKQASGRVVQLTQDKRYMQVWFEFSNSYFSMRFSVYIVWASVLCLNNLKLHKT